MHLRINNSIILTERLKIIMEKLHKKIVGLLQFLIPVLYSIFP